jgi:hypothetical protein
VNFTRLILLLLTFLAVTGEAAELGLSTSGDTDQVHSFMEPEIEMEDRHERQEIWGEDPMVPWLASEKDQAMVFVLGKAMMCAGPHSCINLQCGMKQRLHRWLAVDLI